MFGRGILIGCVVASCLALSVRATNADDTKADEAQAAVQSNYDSIDSSEESKDVDGTIALVAADGVIIDKAGRTHPGTEIHAELATLFLSADTVTPTTTIASFDLKDGGMMVMLTRHVTVILKGINGKTGDTINVDTAVRDYWTQRTDNWLLKREKILSDKTTINNSAFTPIHAKIDRYGLSDLTGSWVAYNDSEGYLTSISQLGKHVIATRRTADGQIHPILWEGDVQPGAFSCRQQLIVNKHPVWVKAQIEMADNDHFSLSNAANQTVEYARLAP